MGSGHLKSCHGPTKDCRDIDDDAAAAAADDDDDFYRHEKLYWNLQT
jgi:hypothetical protein